MFQKASLLILAVVGLTTGASVASAAIVYDDFGGTPKSFALGTSPASAQVLFTLDLPGTAEVRLAELYLSNRNYFQVYAAFGNVVFQRDLFSSIYYADALATGDVWSDGVVALSGGFGNISSLGTGTAGDAFYLRADPTYIPFLFTDTSDGNNSKYGYIRTFTNLTGAGTAAQVTWTVDAYAYQTDGTQIAMGAGEVPEPATTMLLLFGAGIGMAVRRVRRRANC